MEQAVSWGPLLGCLLTVSVACGAVDTGSADGGSGSGGRAGSTGSAGSSNGSAGSSNGSAGSSNGSAGSSNAGSGSAGSGSAGSGSAGSGSAGSSSGSGGAAQPEACRDRPAAEVIADFCTRMYAMDLGTYTEREGCQYHSFRLDYEHGDQTYYYDARGTLVALIADNSFGYSACGVIPSCTGNVVRTCRLCRGSLFVDDNVDDCPTSTPWE